MKNVKATKLAWGTVPDGRGSKEASQQIYDPRLVSEPTKDIIGTVHKIWMGSCDYMVIFLILRVCYDYIEEFSCF